MSGLRENAGERDYLRRQELRDEYYTLSIKERAEYDGVDDYVRQEMDADDDAFFWTAIVIVGLFFLIFH